MTGSLVWRGGNGSWFSALSWSGFRTPTAQDTVIIDTALTTVTLNGSARIAALSLLAGDLALTRHGRLAVAGTLALDGGTLALAGTLVGGTLALGGGSLDGLGGTLDGTIVQGGLSNLGGLTITAATVAANAGAPITADGTLTLAAGRYVAADIVLNPQTLPDAGGTAELDAAGSVTLDARSTLDLSRDQPGMPPNASPASGDTVRLGGAGTLVNEGLVTSDFAAGTLAIATAGFVNAGTLSFAPMTGWQTETVWQPTGRFGSAIPVTLAWNASVAPTLDLASASFINDGMLQLSGGTLAISGAQFHNAGTLLLPDASGQALLVDAGGVASVIDTTLTTAVQVAASVTDFANTGSIAAGLVQFAGAVALPALGRITAALEFDGTLDLAGGTLDASGYGHVRITGTVENGTLLAGSGTLTLDGATLDNVSVTPGGAVATHGPLTLLDPPAGATTVTLDGTTTTLALSPGLTLGSLAITAGSLLATDTVFLPGDVTFGAGVTLDATVAGSTVDIAGGGTLSDAGLLAVDAATLVVGPTLAGAGTISLADGAAVTLEAVSPGATITVAFGSGANLLVLPAADGDLRFTGLTSGDVVDFLHGSQAATLAALAAAAPGVAFTLQDAPSGGTLATVACFRTGTRIATPDGEVAVERLAIGDTVLTAAGAHRPIKWLGRRGYAARFVAANRQLRPVRVAPGALGAGLPRRALELSPQHALLVDGVLIPAGALVNGHTITRADDARDVCYIHIELDGHDLVLAEGAPAETFLDAAGRGMFQNAAEFAELYPDAAPASAACGPRLECGPVVERIRQRLATTATRTPGAGALRGHVERVEGDSVEGWACNDDGSAGPVVLQLLIDGALAETVVANRYRADLDHHALPACGFVARVPRGARIALLRQGDAAALPFAPDAVAA